MTPRLYRWATAAVVPLVPPYLWLRALRGKEDIDRIGERRGLASETRPDGRLVWLHAASVGEAMSVLPLVEALLAAREDLRVLITTITRTSAAILADRLPARAVHQYVPVDRVAWVRRFLDHWRPDLAVWVEKEFWPNLIGETQARNIPTALIQGRMSQGSFQRWRGHLGLIKPMLTGFRFCLVQSPAEVERFAGLGAGPVACVGDLKFAAPPLPYQASLLERLQSAIGSRPRWLAASTHPGEEAVIARTHLSLAERYPDLLTIVVPRHPDRGAAIAEELGRLNLAVASRSRGQPISDATQIYLADTIGELGLFYRLSDIALIGGSLEPIGGHNPLEAARLNCAVLAGPHMENFAAAVQVLEAEGALVRVAGGQQLVQAVTGLLDDQAAKQELITAASALTDRAGDIVATISDHLLATLDGRPVELQGASA